MAPAQGRAGQRGARADGPRVASASAARALTSQPRLALFGCSTTWWPGRARLLFFFFKFPPSCLFAPVNLETVTRGLASGSSRWFGF